jgi:hypothetical protein
MSKHRSGGKFAGGHTTLIEETESFVNAAVKIPEVTKIVLGPIKNMKGLKLSVKFFEIMAGWKIVVCGNTARQEIFFYTSERDTVKAKLEQKLGMEFEAPKKKSP